MLKVTETNGKAVSRYTHRAVAGFTILALAVGAGFGRLTQIDNHLANNARERCVQINVVRAEFLTFIDDTIERSRRAGEATLNNPLATPEQRAAVQRNLDGLKEISADAHEKLKVKPCS